MVIYHKTNIKYFNTCSWDRVTLNDELTGNIRSSFLFPPLIKEKFTFLYRAPCFYLKQFLLTIFDYSQIHRGRASNHVHFAKFNKQDLCHCQSPSSRQSPRFIDIVLIFKQDFKKVC